MLRLNHWLGKMKRWQYDHRRHASFNRFVLMRWAQLRRELCCWCQWHFTISVMTIYWCFCAMDPFKISEPLRGDNNGWKKISCDFPSLNGIDSIADFFILQENLIKFLGQCIARAVLPFRSIHVLPSMKGTTHCQKSFIEPTLLGSMFRWVKYGVCHFYNRWT